MWSLLIFILIHISLFQVSIGKPMLWTSSKHVTGDSTTLNRMRVGDMVLERDEFPWLQGGKENISSHNTSHQKKESTKARVGDMLLESVEFPWVQDDRANIPSHNTTHQKTDSTKVRVGDMVLERDLFDWLRGGSDHNSHHIIRRKIVRQRLWPFNSSTGVPTIPYVLDTSVFWYEDVILQGIKHWNEHTCINIRPKRQHDTHFVKITKGDGCWSQVGKSPDYGGQEVSIGEGCQRVPTVIHELGHAVGLIHEHQRPDRDEYIHVNWGNIDDNSVDQFIKWDNYVVKRLGIPYDYSSVMQYGPMGFTKNGGLSMSTIPSKYQGLIGRHDGLSHRDKRAVNMAYGCIDMWSANCVSKACEDEGYIGPDCKCVCPPGRTGDRCQKNKHDYYTLPSCNRIITEETTLTSPNYPYYIDSDTWCVYEIVAPEGFVPLLTVKDFQLYGWTKSCTDDLLQIRHTNQYDGDVFCGELASGTQIIGSLSTIIMYLEVKTSRSSGFKIQISWANASEAPPVVNPKPGDGPNSGVTDVIHETIQYFTYLVNDIFHSFMKTMFNLLINIFLALKFLQAYVPF